MTKFIVGSATAILLGQCIVNDELLLTIAAQSSEESVENSSSENMERDKLSSIYNSMITQSPVTDAMFTKIPAEDWLRYDKQAGPTMYPDQLFMFAMAEHPDVFKEEADEIRLRLNQFYNVSLEAANKIPDKVILYAYFGDHDNQKLADYIKKETGTGNADPVKIDPKAYWDKIMADGHITLLELNRATKYWFKDQYYQGLIAAGVTENQLDALPDRTVFDAAAQFLMTHHEAAMNKSPQEMLAFFNKIYPDYLKPEKQAQLAKQKELETQQQEKIATHIANRTTDQKLSALKRDVMIQGVNGTYAVKAVFVLPPQTAGNQDKEHTLLGVRYEFTNTSAQEVLADNLGWEAATQFNQMTDNQAVKLQTIAYQLPKGMAGENQTVQPVAAIKPNEKVVKTVYYQLPNMSDKVVLTATTSDQVSDYQVDLTELATYPPQTALFMSTDQTKGYLFDFDKVYALYQDKAMADKWTAQKGVTVGTPVAELSKEAAFQYQQLTNEYTLVKLEDVHYKQQNKAFDVLVGQEVKPVFQVATTNNWQSMQVEEATYSRLVPAYPAE